MEPSHDAARAKNAPQTARRILTRAQIKAIAKVYDGRSETIDDLVKRFHLRRHQVMQAAKRGGYRSTKQRKSWTPEEDQFLHDHWGRIEIEAIAEKLGRSIQSITLRKKRLGISSRDFDDWTIRDLEDAETGLGLDHRLWHRFIELGWVKCWKQPRRNAPPIVRVSIEHLHEFLTSH